MEKLGRSKHFLLYALELCAEDMIRSELKVDCSFNVEILEADDGDIHLYLQDKMYTVGNTGCGYPLEKPFSGIDGIFSKMYEAITDYILTKMQEAITTHIN